MWKSVVLVLAMLVAGSAVAQLHAPSAAQCKRDVDAWWGVDAVDNAAISKRLAIEVGKLIIPQLNKRGMEMSACGVRAEQSGDFSDMGRYADAAQFYFGVVDRRALQFIRRHHLMNQMLAEDAAGKR